jgi:hypothetical protein
MAVIFDPLNSYGDSKKGSNKTSGRAERLKALEKLPQRFFWFLG